MLQQQQQKKRKALLSKFVTNIQLINLFDKIVLVDWFQQQFILLSINIKLFKKILTQELLRLLILEILFP